MTVTAEGAAAVEEEEAEEEGNGREFFVFSFGECHRVRLSLWVTELLLLCTYY